MVDRIREPDRWVSHVWPVTQGLVTQEQMDALVRRHHRSRCSAFDGGANRAMGAGPLTANDRIGHSLQRHTLSGTTAFCNDSDKADFPIWQVIEAKRALGHKITQSQAYKAMRSRAEFG